MAQIDQNTGKDCSIILVGTKLDDTAERVVARNEAEALAKRIGINYIETSAKTNHNVKESF